MRKFNLLVTTFRGQEVVASSEIRDLLNYLGDSSPEVEITKVSGLLTVKTSLDPFHVIERVGEILSTEP
ncbi:MAG: RNA methyltransferase, partial [Nitrososphaerota archaeon]